MPSVFEEYDDFQKDEDIKLKIAAHEEAISHLKKQLSVPAGIVSYLASPTELHEEYERSSGKKHWTNPVCHGELGFATWDYQIWLETEVIRLRAR